MGGGVKVRRVGGGRGVEGVALWVRKSRTRCVWRAWAVG